jgi:ribonuclease Z
VSFTVRILGSSSALPTSRRFLPAHLLNVNEHFFLIDCGEGTQIQLRKYKVKLGKINHIFISHVHGDHIYGLFGLLSTFSLLERKQKLHIFGPDILEDLLLDHLKYFSNELTYELIIHKVNSRRSACIFSDKNVEVFTIPLEHRVPACGFLFREQVKELNMRKEMILKYNIPVQEIVKIKQGADLTTGDGRIIPHTELTLPPNKPRSYAYCSDTIYSENIIDYIKGADLLFHEATFATEDSKMAEITSHSTASQAAEIARRAGVGKLLIGHFSSRYKNVGLLENQARELFPETYAVNDGDLFEVKQKRIIEDNV